MGREQKLLEQDVADAREAAERAELEFTEALRARDLTTDAVVDAEHALYSHIGERVERRRAR